MRNTFCLLIFAIFVSILSESNSNYMLINLDDEEYHEINHCPFWTEFDSRVHWATASGHLGESKKCN